MTRLLGLAFLLASFLPFTACGSDYGGDSGKNPTYQATIAAARSAIQDSMEETGAASVSVALVDGEHVLWSEAFGVADREVIHHATTNTLYATCSISKMFATVAVMTLVDQGKIVLDEPLTTYLPAFSMPLDSRYKTITVRMLLNHSSGLPGYDRKAVTTEPFPEYAAQMLDDLKFQRLLYEPGLISTYNNDGFTMVQNLVKAVSGKSYQDYVRQEILEPLGMSKSQYLDVALPQGAYAKSYDGTSLTHLYSFNVYGSGGLFSTPEELSRLAMMFLNGGTSASRRILSAASVAAMATDQRQGSFNPVPDEEGRYGLGWDSVAQPGLGAVGIKAWQKTGDLSGMYGSDIIVLPEEKLAVIVFGAVGVKATAFSSLNAVKLANLILLQALIERGKLAHMPDPLSSASLPLKAVTAEEKATFPGHYASTSGIMRLRFEADDSLTLERFTDQWISVYSDFKLRSDGWYAADSDPVKAIRLLTESGRTYIAMRGTGAAAHYSYTMMLGQRLEDKTALSSTWQARLEETWLPVDKDLYVEFPQKEESPGFQLKTISGLNGYLLGNKILTDMNPPSADRLDGKFLTIPDNVRETEDIAAETWKGQQWLRIGSYLYRPKSGVPLLATGPSTLTIGTDGFAEWLRLPATGTLSISGSTYWFLYDGAVKALKSGTSSGSPTLSGSGAKYLLLYGTKGTDISLNLTSP